MVSATPCRLRRSTLALAFTLSAALICALSPLASADPADVPDGPVPTDLGPAGDYIVTLADAPIAAYEGDVAGYEATKPSNGERVDVDGRDARRYRSYLRGRQDKVAARVGSKPRARYEVGLNAFTSRLTGAQAARLARTDGVLSVVKDSLHRVPDDRTSVDFLGLSGPGGVWSELGGTEQAGRGVVVGVLDSGIWPESASFADEPPLRRRSRELYVPTRSGEEITMTKSDGATFTGICQTGEQFTVDDCNTKLVGARYFGDTWLARVPADQRADFVSPRDGDGHGSHSASVVAGAHGVRAVVDGRDFGQISGVAPAAKIAAYKVLWEAKKPELSGGFSSDIIAAIEAAIGDGVDVINFSITGDDDPTDPVQLAFLAAARAGIFVAASAGNSGPDASTVQSTSPWVTTVGAHTIAPYYGTVTLGDGDAYAGISTSVTSPVGPAPLVNASALAAAGKTVADATACLAGSLDPQRTAGAIVVCERGDVDRIVKSAEVKRAGGVGMVLINPTPNTLDGDLHSVPTVHLDPPASDAVKAYAATAGARATLTEGNQTSTVLAYPQIARFSSRGPSLGTGGDTLKPDLVAPGVSILGAVAPPTNQGRGFDFKSGTSESAPQVAGLAALWFGAGVQPSWSPMRVKSALMTTATDLVGASGEEVADPFAQGAGRVLPERMLDPGLVYPAGEADWFGYLEGLGMDTDTGVDPIDPSDYNAPAIAVGSLVGTQTVTRRVTAVKPGRYRAAASIPGVDVTVSPSVLSFREAGETRTFRVSMRRTSAAFDKATSGFLTWTGARTRVRIPVALTPKAVDAPDQVVGSGGSGEVTVRVRPGTSGAFPIGAAGLATGIARPGSLRLNQFVRFRVDVPAGTKAVQATVRTPNSDANLDLTLYRVVGNQAVFVAGSATAGPNETVVAPTPEAGTYLAQVDIAANAPGTTATPFTFRAALVQASDTLGAFSVSPTNPQVTAGRPFDLTARWSGVDAGVPYAGWIEYPNGQGTVVTVN